MMSRTLSLALTLAAAYGISACSSGPSASFKSQVEPILAKHCAECHTSGGEGASASGFQVDSYDAVMKGTKYGPVVVAGDPLSSSLYRLVAGKVDKSIAMPHGKEKLSEAEVTAIEHWIAGGAKNN